MDLSRIPFTFDYELKKLRDRLTEVEKSMEAAHSDDAHVTNFDWLKFQKEKYLILEDIRAIEDLFQPVTPDPDSIA